MFAGSRFTTPAESRYAPVEGEALAVADALDRCRMFLLGCPDLLVVVDHRPLLHILNDRSLEDIANPRLFKLKERTLRYRFTIQHTAGKWHRGPDAVSRYPSSRHASTLADSLLCQHPPTDGDDMDTAVLASATVALASTIPEAVVSWEDVRSLGATDEPYQTLLGAINDGFPPKHNTTPALKPFYGVQSRLSAIDGVALMDSRPVIPSPLRARVLEALHSAHQGMAGMKARARQSVYWPGLDKALRNRLDTCHYCRLHAPSHPKEPLILSEPPKWPYDNVAVDYFDYKGQQYLVFVDRFSGNLHLFHFPRGHADAKGLISACRSLFLHYGAPRELASDGGPTFTSQAFRDFLRNWGISHRLSSPYYPQSNGRAEVAVRTGKRIVADCTSRDGSLDNDLAARAILQHRNTPLPIVGKSPAQLLFGRVLRDHIPTNPALLHLHPDWLRSAADREAAYAHRDATLISRHNQSARPLPPLHIGDHVAVQRHGPNRQRYWDRTGTIVEANPHRQYTVRIDGSGQITTRNRRFLRRLPTTPTRPHPPADAVGAEEGEGDDVH